MGGWERVQVQKCTAEAPPPPRLSLLSPPRRLTVKELVDGGVRGEALVVPLRQLTVRLERRAIDRKRVPEVIHLEDVILEPAVRKIAREVPIYRTRDSGISSEKSAPDQPPIRVGAK